MHNEDDDNSKFRNLVLICTLYGHAAPDRAGARPYQLQGKRSGSAVYRSPSHFCHAELAHESRLLCLMPLHAAEHVAKKIKSQ